MTETSDPPERSKPRDRADWADLYRANSLRLVRLATVLVGPSDAADLVAEAVAGAVTSPAWRDVRDPSAYLTRSVVNAAHGHHRSEGRRRGREERAARLRVVGDGGGGTDDAAEATSDRLDVRQALEGLSAQQRAVVHLHYWDDLTIPRIAEVLGVSEGTVRSHLARAKTKLQEVLDV